VSVGRCGTVTRIGPQTRQSPGSQRSAEPGGRQVSADKVPVAHKRTWFYAAPPPSGGRPDHLAEGSGVVELVDQLERAFGIVIDDGDLPESFATVRTIAALVDTKLVSGS
jgi:hypothetical protein